MYQGAGIILISPDKKQCLMLTDNPNHFKNKTKQKVLKFPGGGYEHGETFKTTAIREMKEEACIDINISQLSDDDQHSVTKYYDGPDKGFRLFIAIATEEQMKEVPSAQKQVIDTYINDNINSAHG